MFCCALVSAGLEPVCLGCAGQSMPNHRPRIKSATVRVNYICLSVYTLLFVRAWVILEISGNIKLKTASIPESIFTSSNFEA